MKRIRAAFSTIMLGLFFSATLCSAETYYVDGGPLGSNSNSGLSVTSPLLTIQAALSKCSTGANSVYIRGTHDTFSGQYTLTSPLSINVSGTSDANRMLIRGYLDERPTINGPLTGAQHGIDIAGDYVTLEHLKVQNATGTGIRTDNRHYVNIIDVEVYHTNTSWLHDGGIYHFGGDHHLIKACTIWNNNGHGIKIGDSGINNVVIDGCTIHGNGNYAGMVDPGNLTSHPMGISIPDAGGYNIVRNCTIYANAFKGINLRSIGGTGYNEVYNNIVYDNNHHGSWSYSDQGTYGEIDITAGNHTKIYRNTVFGGVQYGVTIGDNDCEVYSNVIYDNGLYQLAVFANCTGAIIYNNTLYGSSTGAVIQSWSGSSGVVMNNIVQRAGAGKCFSNYGSFTVDYNLWYAPSGSVGVALGPHDKQGDPVFAGLAARDFRRTSQSLYLNQGTDLGTAYSVDRDGSVRGDLWDFGAYVPSSETYVAPPTNLRLKP